MNGIIERMLENAQEHGCLNEVVKSAIERHLLIHKTIFKDEEIRICEGTRR